MKSRKAIDTLSIATKLVLPNDTNTIGNLFGGELLAWMDVIASVSAHRPAACWGVRARHSALGHENGRGA